MKRVIEVNLKENKCPFRYNNYAPKLFYCTLLPKLIASCMQMTRENCPLRNGAITVKLRKAMKK